MTRVLMTTGYLLLATGLICFFAYGLQGTSAHPSLLPACFFSTMLSLLFFNLPAVLARRRDRRANEKGEQPLTAGEELGNRQQSFLGKPDIIVNSHQDGGQTGTHGRNLN